MSAIQIKPQPWAPSYTEEVLAIHLHDEFCEKHGKRSGEKFPPDVWCEYFTENTNSFSRGLGWEGPVHQRWLKKAREIISMVAVSKEQHA